jgi:predicted ester cyclase
MKNAALEHERDPEIIGQEYAGKFAREWIEAWNSHDLKRIMAYCSEDVVLTTPYIATVMKAPSGSLKGKGAVSRYLERTFQRIPDLRFELLDVLPGVRSIVIFSKTLYGRRTAEWMLFGDNGKIVRSVLHHV